MYLDTHTVAWLYEGKLKNFPKNLLLMMAKSELLISPMVVLELAYLYEIKRVQEPSDKVIDTLNKTIDLKICDLPYSQVIAEAIEQTWTRDPFDRIIVAQAAVTQSILVTKDENILKHYAHAIWKEKT
jgi:PIN domain nuclease of toxin-antitoxin system